MVVAYTTMQEKNIAGDPKSPPSVNYEGIALHWSHFHKICPDDVSSSSELKADDSYAAHG